MEHLSKVGIDNNKKPQKQIVSLQSYFHRLYYKTKIRKTCTIEFYNYSKYKKENPFYTLLKVNENGILLSSNIKNKLKELEKYTVSNTYSWKDCDKNFHLIEWMNRNK